MKTEIRSATLSQESEQKYLIAWELHLKLNVLLNKASEEAFKIIEDSIEWVDEEIFQQQGTNSLVPMTRLEDKLVTSLMMICCNMVTLDLCDVNLAGHIAELCRRTMGRGIKLCKLYTATYIIVT